MSAGDVVYAAAAVRNWEWRWEFCPGRYQKPEFGYVPPNYKARGLCPVCGYDTQLISGGRIRHHFREIPK